MTIQSGTHQLQCGSPSTGRRSTKKQQQFSDEDDDQLRVRLEEYEAKIETLIAEVGSLRTEVRATADVIAVVGEK